MLIQCIDKTYQDTTIYLAHWDSVAFDESISAENFACDLSFFIWNLHLLQKFSKIPLTEL
jgi:hypothetical protein